VAGQSNQTDCKEHNDDIWSYVFRQLFASEEAPWDAITKPHCSIHWDLNWDSFSGDIHERSVGAQWNRQTEVRMSHRQIKQLGILDNERQLSPQVRQHDSQLWRPVPLRWCNCQTQQSLHRLDTEHQHWNWELLNPGNRWSRSRETKHEVRDWGLIAAKMKHRD
jgi:hypothetical protein